MQTSLRPPAMNASFEGSIAYISMLGRLSRWEFGTFGKIIRALKPETKTVIVLIHSSGGDVGELTLDVACDSIFHCKAEVVCLVQDCIGPVFKLARRCRLVFATPTARLGVDENNWCHAELAEARGIVSLIVPDLERLQAIYLGDTQ